MLNSVSSIIEALIAYNVIGSYPQPGSGGEYDVQVLRITVAFIHEPFFQDGFGWTNGAILDLLLTYNDRLFVPENFVNATTPPPSATTPAVQTTTKVVSSLKTSWVFFFSVLIYQLF
ncbi:hypothetical protein CAEBREN_11157 [Caenorhabditis brenneri]|uniref:Uncharacterized protein n=1 Tax=Caenorhabditis brenneri TaxID=135651 RepID=G0NH26_CAEBE|nr:hypothetical protein CAEBREN_11157 [Caenorhabditis brenneri]